MKNENGKVILLRRKEKRQSYAPIVLTTASTVSARTYDRVILKKKRTSSQAIAPCSVNLSTKKFFVNSSSIIPRALAGFLALLLSVNPVAIVYATEVGEIETETETTITAAPEEEIAEALFEETSNENESDGIESQPEVFATNDVDLLTIAVGEDEDDALDMEVTESVEGDVFDNEETSDAEGEEEVDTDEEGGEEANQTQNEGSQEDEQEAVSDEQSEEENTQTEETEEDSSEETDGSGDTDDSTVGDTETASTTDDVEDETEGDEEGDTTEDLPDAGENEDTTDDTETASTTDDVGDETDDDEDISTQTDESEDTDGESTDEEEDQEENDGDDDPLSGGDGNETDDSTVGDTETASTTDDVEDETEGDEAEDESEDENSSGEEEDMTEQDETEVVGDDVSAGDQEASEELTEKVIDEVLIRAEIEKVVEARVKKEYEEKMRQFLSEQEENEQKDVSEEEVQNFQSIHGFDDVECEVLSNNEIYCRRGEMLFDGNEKPEVFTGVFAQEEDDDSEIIFQHGGQVRQITDNTHSDINPVYDEKGDIIVWQALVNGRWQIMVHDLAKGITEQISGGGFNNINPHASGGIVVWQGWAGSNWDIFYAQHITLPDQTRAWKAVQVTDNVWPDVDPRVVDGVVLWEAYIGDSWQIFSYETTTGKLVQVSQGKGDNRNPRLVVLWDSIEDGVAQTIQYDISTNERAVVGTGPVPTEDPFSHTPESPIDENQAAMPIQGGASGTSSSSRSDGEDLADE